MPELLTPGVFIQEIDFGPQPIEGVSTSTAGFVGETEHGSEGIPTLVTSFADFQRKFGGFVAGKPLPLAVRGFFDNGGRRAYVVRVLGTGASAATQTIPSGYEVALLAAPQATSTAHQFTLRVASVVGAQVGQNVTLIVTNGLGSDIDTLAIVAINSVSNTLTIDAGTDAKSLLVAAARPNTHAVRYIASAGGSTIVFTAKDRGSFGNRVSVLLTPVYVATGSVSSVVTASTTFIVNQIAPFKVGQIVEFENAAGERQYTDVTAILTSASRITVTTLTGTAPVAGDTIRITGWQLDVFLDEAPVETLTALSSINDDLVASIDNSSQWVTASTPTLAIRATNDTLAAFPFFAQGKPASLSSGGDGGTVDATAVVGSDTGGVRTGLKALEAQDGVNIIAAPGFTGNDFRAVVDELIGQAERKTDRFAVFESNDEADISAVLSFRGNFSSKFAAMYHPWITVLDPLSNTVIPVPPTGHILGAYARTDNDRGVFKAPANVTLRGIIDFTHNVPDGEQDILNPKGVNVLRRFTGLGPVIWGARTIAAEPLWRYVPVRRLFIFIEQSLVQGTRFAVFEPNDQRLWANLHDAVSNFLTTQWRAGALFGTKPEEAFFVKVDETTTTQDDRDNGRVNILVGIAPVRPAEFIVFQIGQAPESVIIAEQG